MSCKAVTQICLEGMCESKLIVIKTDCMKIEISTMEVLKVLNVVSVLSRGIVISLLDHHKPNFNSSYKRKTELEERK